MIYLILQMKEKSCESVICSTYAIITVFLSTAKTSQYPYKFFFTGFGVAFVTRQLSASSFFIL